MQQFFENNWLSILSILIGIVVAYVFYRLQKKDGASASAERKKHATLELLDVVESYIINKQHLSEGVIENLIHASERDHAVALRPDCTAISLLQDVALRLQRSRHLDIPQKSEYSEKIEHLIGQIRESRAPVQIEAIEGEFAAHLNELIALVPNEHKSKADKLAATITSSTYKQRETKRFEEAKMEVIPVAAAILGVAASLASILIGSKASGPIGEIATSVLFGKLVPMMGVALALTVAMAALKTALRIKRRAIETREREEKADG